MSTREIIAICLMMIIIGILSCFIFSCSLTWDQLYDFELDHNPGSPSEFLTWISINIEYKRDKDDYWQTPRETLSRGSGDCEDIAILMMCVMNKYFGCYPDIIAWDYNNDLIVDHMAVVYRGMIYDGLVPEPLYNKGTVLYVFSSCDIYNFMQFKRN